jgi:Secretion system C-terminal sorting domain
MNKKILLMVQVLMLGFLASAQHLETTIKIVNNKAHIAIKAVGGNITGYASNYVFVVAIPRANADAGVLLNTPEKLDASRTSANVVVSLPAYSDSKYKYFLLFYTGTPPNPTVFSDGVEYDILELTWSGPLQSFPVSLMSLPNGNPGNPLAPSQWQQYLEIGGAEVSTPHNYFYQSETSTVPTNADNYSTGTAIVTTRSAINKPTVIPDNPTSLTIGGLFPNPARSQVNVIIDAPKRDNVTLVVMDVNGKTVKQQLVNVEIGSNTVPVEISNLAQGAYLVKVICKENCETTVAKFNKQ